MFDFNFCCCRGVLFVPVDNAKLGYGLGGVRTDKERLTDRL